MGDIFDLIKKEVPLEMYLKEIGAEIKSVGEGSFRANPCPCCGHKDCFTFYDQNQTFHCFSCGTSGDVIHLERHLQSHGSNCEAAKKLTEKFAIEASFPKGPAESEQTRSTPAADQNSSPICIKRQREVRKFAAEFFHQQLLRNPADLSYQMQERGHSLEVLQHFMVGVAGGDLIGQATKMGFSAEELVAVGLVRKNKNGYRPYIPNGHFVYPHWSKGEVLFFSIKDPAGKKKFQILKKFADPDWLCMNQDVLGGDVIYIVEGENDLLSIVDKDKQPNVLATIGNFNTSRILDHLGKHSAGKRFYLIFDQDEAGEKYMSKYAAAITNGGGKAYQVKIPPPHKDIDEQLRAIDDPEAVFTKLIENADIQTPLTPSEEVLSLGDFNSFEVLGELADERIVFWSKNNSKIYTVTIKDLSLDKLDQIGGAEVTERVSRKPQEGKVSFRRLKRIIITEASKRQLGHPNYLGQGVHLLKEKQLLLVNGGEAWLWNGEKAAVQKSPLIENKFISWQPGAEWIDAKAVLNNAEHMSIKEGLKILDSLLSITSQWKFHGQYDHFIVTGWFLAQIVQTIWDWRPHLWFSGSQGSGKTLLTLLFESLGGRLARRFEGQGSSEAGIRQGIGNDSVLVTVDEFERTIHREKIIELCRSASRGGKISKGSPNQSTINYHIKHMFFLASIEVGIHRAAENPRFIIIESVKEANRAPKIPAQEGLEKLRIDIFAYAVWASLKAKGVIPQVKPIPGIDPRLLESLAVVFSMIAVCCDDPDSELNNLLDAYFNEWVKSQQGNFIEDEQKLIEDILMANVRLPLQTEGDDTGDEKIVYDYRTVAQLIEMSKLSDENHTTLQSYGVKGRREGIFIHPDKVKRMLLQNTDFAQLSIREILLRVSGATSIRDRIAGSQVRGVLIPAESLTEYLDEESHTVTG